MQAALREQASAAACPISLERRDRLPVCWMLHAATGTDPTEASRARSPSADLAWVAATLPGSTTGHCVENPKSVSARVLLAAMPAPAPAISVGSPRESSGSSGPAFGSERDPPHPALPCTGSPGADHPTHRALPTGGERRRKRLKAGRKRAVRSGRPLHFRLAGSALFYSGSGLFERALEFPVGVIPHLAHQDRPALLGQ